MAMLRQFDDGAGVAMIEALIAIIVISLVCCVWPVCNWLA